MAIRLAPTLHVWQLLLYHIQTGTAGVARGRIRQAPMVVQNVMHVVAHVVHLSRDVGRLKLLAHSWCIEGRSLHFFVLVLLLLVAQLQLEVDGRCALGYGATGGARCV